MNKNTICLWYNHDAEEAARFYAKTFPNSSVDSIHRAPSDFPGGKAELVTFGHPPRRQPKMWVPGRVVAFRTDSTIPDAPGSLAQATGKAGHVYRIGEDMATLEDVAEFQPTVPNDSLAYTYGN